MTVTTEDHCRRQIVVNTAAIDDPKVTAIKHDRARLERHFGIAVPVDWSMAQSKQRADLATMTLNMFRTGAVWLSAQTEVLYANQEMDAIAGKRDGIQVSNGRLRLWDPNARQGLVKGIEAAIAEQSSGLLAKRPSGLPPYRVNVMPLPMQARALRLPNAAAIAFVSEATAPTSASLQAARGMYNLTPAEAKITEKLAAGLDPRQIADALGSSINTVRTQVKSILAKTGVSRQADLIRLVATLPQVGRS